MRALTCEDAPPPPCQANPAEFGGAGMMRGSTALTPLHDMTESKCSVVVEGVLMARSTTRPVVTLRSTAGTGFTYVTRKNRLADPDRLVVRKYDPVAGRHVLFREAR